MGVAKEGRSRRKEAKKGCKEGRTHTKLRRNVFKMRHPSRGGKNISARQKTPRVGEVEGRERRDRRESRKERQAVACVREEGRGAPVENCASNVVGSRSARMRCQDRHLDHPLWQH